MTSLREAVARKLVELSDRDCGCGVMDDEEWAEFWLEFAHLWAPQADEMIAVVTTALAS